MSELVSTRRTLDVSQRLLARELGRSQTALVRLEHLSKVDRLSIVDVAQVASLLGLELSASLHPVAEGLRDGGHQALLRRFRALLDPAIKVVAEVPLPNQGDRRSWDLLIRIAGQRVGVEAETRVRDIQWLTRRTRERELDGGTDEVLLVLADTAINRRVLLELRESLGERFETSSRLVLRALRAGRPLPGSGVIVV